jgi:DNA adenine methylase
MPDYASPLRYPGGKAGLSKLLTHIIDLNRLQDSVYAEPYAGGAGAALGLLFAERVSRVLLNDLDYRVYAFWVAMLREPDRFLDLLEHTPITIQEWKRQRLIYRAPTKHSLLRVGFATFFLNRCNRSGILVNGGPIGGCHQKGPWKLDARFNRPALRRRIQRILAYRDRIQVWNLDAIEFVRAHVIPQSRRQRAFVYLDPPYYAKGRDLYLNAYTHADHVRVATFIRRIRVFHWLLSYDNTPEIAALYAPCNTLTFDLSYAAYERRAGRELLICDPRLGMPPAATDLIAGVA